MQLENPTDAGVVWQEVTMTWVELAQGLQTQRLEIGIDTPVLLLSYDAADNLYITASMQ